MYVCIMDVSELSPCHHEATAEDTQSQDGRGSMASVCVFSIFKKNKTATCFLRTLLLSIETCPIYSPEIHMSKIIDNCFCPLCRTRSSMTSLTSLKKHHVKMVSCAREGNHLGSPFMGRMNLVWVTMSP